MTSHREHVSPGGEREPVSVAVRRVQKAFTQTFPLRIDGREQDPRPVAGRDYERRFGGGEGHGANLGPA